MKTFSIVLSACLFLSASAFAGTPSCEKLAVNAALSNIVKKVADDCFVRFVQPNRANPDVVTVGVACDHAGSFLYQLITEPNGDRCRISRMRSKAIDRNL